MQPKLSGIGVESGVIKSVALVVGVKFTAREDKWDKLNGSGYKQRVLM
jgi:hypothetical protein